MSIIDQLKQLQKQNQTKQNTKPVRLSSLESHSKEAAKP